MRYLVADATAASLSRTEIVGAGRRLRRHLTNHLGAACRESRAAIIDAMPLLAGHVSRHRSRRGGTMSRSLRLIAALAVSLGLCTFITQSALGPAAKAQTTGGFPSPSWIDTFGPVALSSPTVATVNGEVVVAFASQNGYVDVVDAATGQSLPGWPEPVEIAPNTPTAVESSPTIAYLDGPTNPPSVVVGAGSTYVANQQGGLVAFNFDGSVRFTFQTRDVFGVWSGSATPDGYSEGVFSTPAVGDVTGNGQADLVFGSWDHRLYALSPSGALIPGFPIDTQDTIWSSPALFHIRGNPTQQDIFIGGDASGLYGCHGGFIYDVTYRNQRPAIVWKHCERQTIWSSPAIGAINATHNPVVVVGTGFGYKPPYKAGTDRLYAFYARSGATVKGWPVPTAGPVFGSPAIGLLGGSTSPTIVDTSWCATCTGASANTSEVYAYTSAGTLLWSQQLSGPSDFSSPILVDLTGTGTNDVLVGDSAGLYPLDGATGAFMFNTTETKAINPCSVQNSAAVAYVPGTGPTDGWRLFETCGGPREINPVGHLYDYPLPNAPAVAPPWSMWRNDPSHDGVASWTFASLSSSSRKRG